MNMNTQVVENDKKNLLNNLSDAIKECQLRFGGKRELATEMDGRVCFLCLKLEALFLHGLRKSFVSQLNSSVNSLQLGSIINLKNKSLIKTTGNLLSQFLEENKMGQQIKQNIDSISTETSFWPFIKNFMNKFDVERFEMLANVKTDLGRQRAWIRSCLNEHCLERYIVAILANQAQIREYYEDWCFLLDKSYNSNLPMLISGLQSILFAINIDNSSLNAPNKIQPLASGAVAPPVSTATRSTSSMEPIEEQTPPTVKNNAMPSSLSTRKSKIKKSNIVIDNDTEANDSPIVTGTTSATVDATFEFNESTEKPSTESVQSVEKKVEFNILTNPINYTKSKKEAEESVSKKTTTETSDVESGDDNSMSSPEKENGDSASSAIINKTVIQHSSLIPISPSQTPSANSGDTISINSYQSEYSNDTNHSQYHNSPQEVLSIGSYSSASRSNRNRSMAIEKQRPTTLNNTTTTTPSFDSSSKRGTLTSSLSVSVMNGLAGGGATSSSYVADNLSMNEMREVTLSMIQRREQLEDQIKKLKEALSDEQIRNAGLLDEITLLRREMVNGKQTNESRIQALESENKLLKDQLKKYVSAVQMIRSNNEPAEPVAASSSGGNALSSFVQPMPAVNQNLQRDYSYEAEQYEKKLIQVAEMHGELMEFNSRLHRILNLKNLQIEKLTNELVELRGPLPNEMIQSNLTDDAASVQESEAESLANINMALINIWIPSAFLRSDKSGSHHVYQIYIRIKDEEWNIYRRFSHFYALNLKLREKYPIVNSLAFPKKKTLGNKDAKFVEKRRKELQDYLRQIINLVCRLDKDLNMKPCRETLIRAIPFLNDEQFFAALARSSDHRANSTLSTGSSYQIGTTPNTRNLPIAGAQNSLSSSFGNNLGQLVVATRSSTDLIGSQLSQIRQNEPLYTGL